MLSSSLDVAVDFFPVNGNVGWCVYAQSYFVSANLDHNERDVVVNPDLLVDLPAEN